ncbi:MAG: hypothetical protein WED85_13670 [Dehalococcoidia bacterium]
MKYNERIEIRLDPEHARKVAELREVYHATTSDVVRKSIDAAHQELVERKRKEALDWIVSHEGFEDVPDVETIKRQSGRSNDPELLDPY